MPRKHVVVIGAGIGGLACAASLAAQQVEVTLFERGALPGGRVRQLFPAGQPVDCGPTVFTLADVFRDLFAQTGERLEDHLGLTPLALLARHAWSDGSRLDLHADAEANRAAITDFAGTRDADGFQAFCRDAAALHQALDGRFMRVQRPGLTTLAARLGPLGAWRLRAGAPFTSLWSALGRYFRDPRLRQLFGRYATYVGSSPFEAPAVLMLIAHVELAGVQVVDGGMVRLAQALAALAARRGVELRYGEEVAGLCLSGRRACGIETLGGERVDADAVVFNGDPGALGQGQLGRAAQRAVDGPGWASLPASLSALTHAWHARVRGFPLAHHTVFFSSDTRREFDQLFAAHRLPGEPTVYLCAQDRLPGCSGPAGAPERLFAIINAPALDGTAALTQRAAALQAARDAALALLARCGLRLDIEDEARDTPEDFAARFPGSGGAIYGRACHGWRASFQRPGARSRIAGLYLAGGGVHPGPGLPMVALSGRLAADAVLADLGA